MDQEKLIYVTDEHWVKYVTPLIVWIALTMAGTVLFYMAGKAAYHQTLVTNPVFLIACVVVLTAQHIFFYRVLSDDLDQIIVTSKRIIVFRTDLFLHDDMTEIPLEKIKVVDADKHGLVQNILNYGTLHFDPHWTVERVPHPHHMAHIITQELEMS